MEGFTDVTSRKLGCHFGNAQREAELKRACRYDSSSLPSTYRFLIPVSPFSPPMAWHSLPSRRESTVIIFSITIFVLFYNLESSFERLRARQGSTVTGPVGEGSVNWEKVLYGDWTWEEQQVAKNAQARREELAKNSTSLWGPRERGLITQHPEIYGTVGVNDGYVNWGDKLPTTTVMKHVPGKYKERRQFLISPLTVFLIRLGSTILDHVFLLNGTIYLVTDDSSFPPLGSIASSTQKPAEVPQPSEWQVLTTKQGREILGQYGGL